MKTRNFMKYLGGVILLVFIVLAITSFVGVPIVDIDPISNISYATIGFAFTGLGADAFDNVEPSDGDENMGGYGQVAYLALRSHIAGYPTIPPASTPTSIEELCDLQGDYSFLTDKHFIKLLIAPNTLSLDPVSQGDYPGAKSFNLKGSFTIAGLKPTQRGLARILNNSYGVLIIPEEDGSRIAIGSELRPVHFSPKGKSGTKAADAKGMEYEFVTDSFVPGYNYKGVIVLDGETLPAIS